MSHTSFPRPTLSPRSAMLALLLVAACATPYQSIAKELDEVEEHLEAWGSASVSGAILVPDAKRFATEYDRPLEEHIQAAQNQLHAGVAKSLETATEVRSSTRASNVVGAEPSDDVTPPEVTATDTFADDRFQAPQSLLSGQQFTIPLTDSIRAGYSSKFQELLLDFLANPGKLTHGDLHLVVAQISCNPGWRTRTDYMADVRISVELTKKSDEDSDPRRSIMVDEDLGTVRVAAVLPLLESQNVDMRVSLRDQVALLNSLSAALQNSGALAESSTVSQIAKRFQQDSASRTALPSINGYAAAEGFGYQFRPVYQAIDDLTDPRSQGEYVLNPVSFPVLALVVVEDGKDATHLSLSADTRWYRLERPDLLSMLGHWVSWPFNKILQAESETPTRSRLKHRIKNLERLDEAYLALRAAADAEQKRVSNYRNHKGRDASAKGNENTHVEPAYRSYALAELHDKLANLYEAYVRRPQFVKIAKKDSAKFTATKVHPTAGWVDQETALVIHGSGFGSSAKPKVKSVTVGGRACRVSVLGDGSLVAILPALDTNLTKVSDQEVVIATGKEIAKLGPIDLELRAKPHATTPTFAIDRDGDGRVTKIRIDNPDGVSAEDLLERIQAVLESENCSDDFELEFNLGATGGLKASAESGQDPK